MWSWLAQLACFDLTRTVSLPVSAALLQDLQESLRQHEADRMQRLAAAATTASALHLQQRHVRGLAAASATAAAAAGAEQHHSACASLAQDGQQSARLQGPDTPRDRGSPRGAGREFSSGGAAAASGEAALRLLLPSSGASAAATIAKRGAVQPSRLPSRAARAEVSLSPAICSRRCHLLYTPRYFLILLEPCWGPVVLGVATAAALLVLCCSGWCRHAAADRPGGSQGGHAGSTSSSHCSHGSSIVRSWAQRRRQCVVDRLQQHSQHQHGRQRQATACAQHARCVAGQQHEWCRCSSG